MDKNNKNGWWVRITHQNSEGRTFSYNLYEVARSAAEAELKAMRRISETFEGGWTQIEEVYQNDNK